jgi:hypothetical protein
MLGWLYRHVFRGVGILFWVGLVTILYLALSFLAHRSNERPAGSIPETAVHRPMK